MVRRVAFITYPVSDINGAREFYEGLLGLRLSQDMGGEWLEVRHWGNYICDQHGGR
jgi:catechol 2,3-dioxygenase-like lactoylglutathione lyase family enzyme